MKQTTRDITKRRAEAPGTPVMVRLQPDLLERVDRWIAKNEPSASRPAAIRAILEKALK